MVGHTGVLPAVIRAVETVDRCLERVLASAERAGCRVLITADHGNCEMMIDPGTGGVHTAHTTNPVPLVAVGAGSAPAPRRRLPPRRGADGAPPARHRAARRDDRARPEGVLMGTRVRLAVVLLLALAGATPAAAPGGARPPGRHRTATSAKGHTITAIGGYFSGRRRPVRHRVRTMAPFGGIRYDIRNSSSLAMALQVIYGDFDRLIVDPFVARLNRVSGPVKQSVTFAEASIQFNLTGGKTWHRLAPFLGADDRPQLSQQHPAGHQRLRAGTQGRPSRPGAGFRLFLTARGSPPGRGPGRLLEAQLSPQLHPGAAGRPGHPGRPPRGDHRRQRERMGHQRLVPGRAGLRLLPLRWRSS